MNDSETGTTGPNSSLGLDPKIGAVIAYVGGWVTGIVMFVLEQQDDFIRFHAMQSILTFGGLTVLFTAVSIVPGVNILAIFLSPLVGIASLVVWIMLLIKAGQGERYKLPVVGDLAEQYSKR